MRRSAPRPRGRLPLRVPGRRPGRQGLVRPRDRGLRSGRRARPAAGFGVSEPRPPSGSGGRTSAGPSSDTERAMLLDPKSGEAFFNRGVIRQARGDLDGAVADFTVAARILAPTDIRPLAIRGQIRRFRKRDVEGRGRSPTSTRSYAGARGESAGLIIRGQYRAKAGSSTGPSPTSTAAIRVDPEVRPRLHGAAEPCAWRAKGSSTGPSPDFGAAARPDMSRPVPARRRRSRPAPGVTLFVAGDGRGGRWNGRGFWVIALAEARARPGEGRRPCGGPWMTSTRRSGSTRRFSGARVIEGALAAGRLPRPEVPRRAGRG